MAGNLDIVDTTTFFEYNSYELSVYVLTPFLNYLLASAI